MNSPTPTTGPSGLVERAFYEGFSAGVFTEGRPTVTAHTEAWNRSLAKSALPEFAALTGEAGESDTTRTPASGDGLGEREQILAWLRRDLFARMPGEKVFAQEILERLIVAIERGEHLSPTREGNATP